MPLGCTAPLCALILALASGTQTCYCPYLCPLLSCLILSPWSTLCCHQVTVSILYPKAGLRVTLVCIGAVQQNPIYGFDPSLIQESTDTKAWTPEQGLVRTLGRSVSGHAGAPHTEGT